MREPTIAVECSIWRRQGATDGKRIIPEETAVAFTYDGGSYAVMMATPQNLEDFALGFSFTEGLVASPADIRHLEVIEHETGIELRMWLAEPRAAALSERRRHLAGPTGCGLCGIESLDEAVRPLRRVGDGGVFAPAEIMRALDTLAPRQELNRQTRAVHAAAFWRPEAGLVAVREDVGRHNALDKLAGCARPRRHASGRRHGAAHQPRIGGNGAENRCNRRSAHRRRFRADGARGAHRRERRDHAGRGGARRRLRDVHPPPPHQRTRAEL